MFSLNPHPNLHGECGLDILLSVVHALVQVWVTLRPMDGGSFFVSVLLR